MNERLIKKLEEYLSSCPKVSFAYLFGSATSGRMHTESDIDIGVYFTPPTGELEYESETEYPGEDNLWLELERLVGRKTDLVVLNRAPATLLSSILQTGTKIFVRDEKLLSRLWLATMAAAEDWREFISDFAAIRARSNSVSAIDRERLTRMVAFLEQELGDFKTFKVVTQKQYVSQLAVKRNLERWAENIVNASIDIAKIILASEKRAIPETYRLIIEQLETVGTFDHEMAKTLAAFFKMRNILAHEYLDLRFAQLQKFVAQAEPAYQYLADFTKRFIK